MNDAFGVRCIERVGNLNAKVEHLVKWHGLLADPMFQRLPFEQLHGDERNDFTTVGRYVDLINCADIGMVQRRGGARFPLKPFKRCTVL